MKKAAALGQQIDLGESLTYVVTKGQWFTRLVEAAETDKEDIDDGLYTVFSCSLIPGFDIRDFKAAKYKDLIKWWLTFDVSIYYLKIKSSVVCKLGSDLVQI